MDEDHSVQHTDHVSDHKIVDNTTLLLNVKVTESSTSPWWHIPYRHKLAFLTFLGFMNVYAMRVNLSVAMVAMVNSTNTNKSVADSCLVGNTTHKEQYGDFAWDKKIQEQVLGSFFYGYIITQIPGGWLAGRFGAKWPYGLGILCTTVFTLLTPVAANISPYLLIAVRILEGLGEGVTFPAAHALFSKWSPPLERSKLLTFVYGGAYFGSAICLPIAGILCDSHLLGGWPSVFYLTGVCGLLWTVAWFLFAYNSPADHPRLSKEEREFIASSLEDKQEGNFEVPWFKILTSHRVWAIVITHFCANWAFYTLLTNLPLYLKDILGFDISQSGTLAALPYITQFICCAIGGQVADFLRSRGYLSTTVTRKVFNTVGLLLQAGFLIGVVYAGCNEIVAVLCLTLSVGLGGITSSGFNVNHLDIAPRYAGVLMGLTNTAATIPGFLGPLVVGVFIGKEESRHTWMKVFFLSAGIDVIGVLVFLFMSTGVQQPWAKVKEEEIDEDSRDKAKRV